MTTVDERTTATREDALKFAAGGHTAASLRAHASNPAAVHSIAAASGDTTETVEALMLSIADGIELLNAAGLTAERCRELLGLTGIPVPTPRAAEPWVGSGRCSDCAGNHVPGSRGCGCWCHTRGSRVPAPAVPAAGGSHGRQ